MNDYTEDCRPDPEQLLKQVNEEEEKAVKGKLKIFFGYSAGVGKTYAMLLSAHDLLNAGKDVAIGYIEPHTRPDTLALLEGLERISPKTINYRGIELKEFDIDQAIKRKPEILLVDELAHTNAEGSRHRKRYQDVEEILSCGIDVLTTVNVQHLESLNDVVAAITNIKVKETIPDYILTEADQIELIDIEPEELLKRLNAGKVYKKEQTVQALAHFFTKENLIALREIALRRIADVVNLEIESTRMLKKEINMFPTSEQLLVCITASPTASRVIRIAARMAEAYHAKWVALYVETPSAGELDKAVRDKKLQENFNLAEQLGAEPVTIYGEDIAKTIIDYASFRNITKIVIGRNQNIKKFRIFKRKDIVGQLIETAHFFDIHVIPGHPDDYRNSVKKIAKPINLFFIMTWQEIMLTLLVLAGATALAFLLNLKGFNDVNIIMIYILCILFISIVTRGYLVGILASILAVVLFNFFFTAPRYSLDVYNRQYYLTFPFLIIIAAVTSTLVTRIKQQAELSIVREKKTNILYEINKELNSVTDKNKIVKIALENLVKFFNRDMVCFLPECENKLVAHMLEIKAAHADFDVSVAEWVYHNNDIAGQGTDTLPGANGFYMPISGKNKVLGVIGIASDDAPIEPESFSFLETIVGQIAIVLEREQLLSETENVKMEVERERLRSNLLRAISHDLRSPLTSIEGASGTIIENKNLDEAAKTALLKGIYDDAEWLIRLVENLLSMTRIDEGKLEVKKNLEAVEEVISEAVSRVKKRSLNQKISVNIPRKLLLVPMDGKLIEQVLINLLDNALKFSRDDSEVVLNVYQENKNVIFDIIDNGPGIPEQALPQLFNRFFTLDNKIGDSRRGVGLGLAICKSIITAHGGKIEAHNRTDNKGAIFRFTLSI